MRLELLEQDVFHTQYQRNNKAKAKKNLRCFPACRRDGHVQAGFCGRAVTVRVSHTLEELSAIGATGLSAFGVVVSAGSVGVTSPAIQTCSRRRRGGTAPLAA